jgi:hypothetical protein
LPVVIGGLVLILGIVLGAGFVTNMRINQLTDNNAQLVEASKENQETLDRLTENKDLAENYLRARQSSVLAGVLQRTNVTLIATGSTSDATVQSAQKAITDAGGLIATTVRLKPAFLDPSEATRLDSFSSTLAQGKLRVAGLPATGVGPALLGTIVQSTAAGRQLTPDSRKDGLEAFKQAGFIEYTGPVREAQVALVLDTSRPDSGPAGAYAAQTLRSLLLKLDEVGMGTVLAGTPSAAADQGVLSLIRADVFSRANISTVDSLPSPVWMICAIFALADQQGGKTRHFGIGPGAQSEYP